MRTETRTVRIGEDVGPVDWLHPTAADKPELWREAEDDAEGIPSPENLLRHYHGQVL